MNGAKAKRRIAADAHTAVPLAGELSGHRSSVSGSMVHTPGPWSVTWSDGADFHVTTPDATDPDNPWNIAIVIGSGGYRDDPRTGSSDANASLIAAAPDLLAVARACANLAEKWGEQGPLVEAARAAVAKALMTNHPAPAGDAAQVERDRSREDN